MLIKVGSNICPTLNKPSHSCLRLLKYSQNGEISAKSGHTALRTFYLDNVRPPSTFLPLGQVLKQKRRQTLSRQDFVLQKIQNEHNRNVGRGQCDQMVGFFFNIWPFTTMQNNVINLPICQRLLHFCESGEISLNLVTLDAD